MLKAILKFVFTHWLRIKPSRIEAIEKTAFSVKDLLNQWSLGPPRSLYPRVDRRIMSKMIAFTAALVVVFYFTGHLERFVGTSIQVYAPIRGGSPDICNVSTNAELQAALDGSAPCSVGSGDEIVLADGTYTAEFDIDTISGVDGSPITVRAANRHQAILQGANLDSRSENAFSITQDYWIIQDLEIKEYGRPILVGLGADFVTIQDNLIHSFKTDGVRFRGNNGVFQQNVIAHGTHPTQTGAAVDWVSANDGVIIDNIFIGNGDDGYQADGKLGGGLLVGGSAGTTGNDNLIKGNLLYAEGGKQVFRILAGLGQPADRNVVRDNMVLWGEGGFGTSDCDEDSNSFINNIVIGNYHSNGSSKGNRGSPDRGHHLFQHNFTWIDKFARTGQVEGSGGCGGVKVDNTYKDNLYYSEDAMSNQHILFQFQDEATTKLAATNNLFYAIGADTTWVGGYTYDATDIHDGVQPTFTNKGAGDFSLAGGSSGENGASDGTDIGVTYNSFLKKAWMANIYALETQEKTGLPASTSFTVSANHFYKVWFHLPVAGVSGSETFTVEGTALVRNLTTLEINTWTQDGGPARWITLGTHKATDGTMNILWVASASADAIHIKKIPNPSEAYQWIVGGSGSPITSMGGQFVGDALITN